MLTLLIFENTSNRHSPGKDWLRWLEIRVQTQPTLVEGHKIRFEIHSRNWRHSAPGQDCSPCPMEAVVMYMDGPWLYEVSLSLSLSLTHTHTQTHPYAYINIHSISYIIFHRGLVQETGYSSLCFTAGPHCLSILKVILCTSEPHILSSSKKAEDHWEELPHGFHSLPFMFLFPSLQRSKYPFSPKIKT